MIFDRSAIVVFDTSIFVGLIFEKIEEEQGRALEAFEHLKRQGNHKLGVSEEIVEETVGRLWGIGQRGYDYILELMETLRELEEESRVVRPTKDLNNISIRFPIPSEVEHDTHVIKTAIAFKNRNIVCIVHKNPRDFNLVKDKMRRHHGIYVLTSEEYIDP
ncbi:hypothetical protein DRO97_07295 [Archaeoglobales archaeon]|nr:MAG: hypothetical protein DRO97_07295 [Archaeoglobales archaeon]